MQIQVPPAGGEGHPRTPQERVVLCVLGVVGLPYIKTAHSMYAGSRRKGDSGRQVKVVAGRIGEAGGTYLVGGGEAIPYAQQYICQVPWAVQELQISLKVRVTGGMAGMVEGMENVAGRFELVAGIKELNRKKLDIEPDFAGNGGVGCLKEGVQGTIARLGVYLGVEGEAIPDRCYASSEIGNRKRIGSQVFRGKSDIGHPVRDAIPLYVLCPPWVVLRGQIPGGQEANYPTQEFHRSKLVRSSLSSSMGLSRRAASRMRNSSDGNGCGRLPMRFRVSALSARSSPRKVAA